MSKLAVVHDHESASFHDCLWWSELSFICLIRFQISEHVQDWPVPLQDVNDELLRCGVCGGYLGLVAQVLSMYSFLPACETFRLHIYVACFTCYHVNGILGFPGCVSVASICNFICNFRGQCYIVIKARNDLIVEGGLLVADLCTSYTLRSKA